jgi:hypothetical protein
MRLTLLAAASAFALGACSPTEPAAGSAEAPAADTAAPAADTNAGRDVAAMDDTMKAADTADDQDVTVTPDNHMFHTYPKKIEIVRLPAGGGVWEAHGYAPADIFKMLNSKDEKLADGTNVHAIEFEMLASGNGKVVFEKRQTGKPDEPVIEARTVSFMIH